MGSGDLVSGSSVVPSRRVTQIGKNPFLGLGIIHDQGVIGLDHVELFHAPHLSTCDGDNAIVIISQE